MDFLTRKIGIWIASIGIVIFLSNFLTLYLWEIDIDILGFFIFILGLILIIACNKTMKKSNKLLTRRNGVKVCIFAIIVTTLFAYSTFPALNGDVAGIIGMIVFLLGLILIAVRWKY